MLIWKIAIFVTTFLVLVSCKQSEENPLITDWQTPFATPPFDKIKPEHYLPAFKEAVKIHTEEIDNIE